MASFLESLFASQPGGIYGLLPAQSPGPDWEAIRRANLGLPSEQPLVRYNPDAPGGMVDLRGGGSLAVPPGPTRAPQRAFGYGAQDLSGLTPSGLPPFISQPDQVTAVPEPAPIPRASPVAPAMMLTPSDNLPPASTLTAGRDLPAPSRPPPPQYQAQPQQQPQYRAPEPDLGDRLFAGFANFGSGGSLVNAITNSITGLQTGQRTDPVGAYNQAAAQVYSLLRQRGYSHPDAALAATNPQALKQIIEGSFGQQKPSGTLKLGDTEIPYMLGPGGQMQLLTPGSGPSGGGGGGSLPDLVNLNQQIAAAGAQRKASATAQGEVQGKSAAILPATLASADQALQTIDQLQKHPGKSQAIGRYGPIPLNLIPAIGGTEQGNFVTLLEQAQGQTFLQAYNQLKGAGAISEAEGAKATQAVGRLNRAQTVPAFDQALNELRGVITAGKQNAQRIAGGSTQSYTSPTPVAGWTTVSPGVRIREVK